MLRRSLEKSGAALPSYAVAPGLGWVPAVGAEVIHSKHAAFVDDAAERALEAMARRPFAPQPLSDGLFVFRDELAAARLLLPERFETLGLTGAPMVAVPHDHALLIADSNKPEAVAALLALLPPEGPVDRQPGEGASELFTLADGRWVEAAVDDPRLAALHSRQLASTNVEVLDSLRVHGAPWSMAIAPTFARADGQWVTCWSKGAAPVLLACERLVLIDTSRPPGDQRVEVPWSAFTLCMAFELNAVVADAAFAPGPAVYPSDNDVAFMLAYAEVPEAQRRVEASFAEARLAAKEPGGVLVLPYFTSCFAYFVDRAPLKLELHEAQALASLLGERERFELRLQRCHDATADFLAMRGVKSLAELGEGARDALDAYAERVVQGRLVELLPTELEVEAAKVRSHVVVHEGGFRLDVVTEPGAAEAERERLLIIAEGNMLAANEAPMMSVAEHVYVGAWGDGAAASRLAFPEIVPAEATLVLTPTQDTFIAVPADDAAAIEHGVTLASAALAAAPPEARLIANPWLLQGGEFMPAPAEVLARHASVWERLRVAFGPP